MGTSSSVRNRLATIADVVTSARSGGKPNLERAAGKVALHAGISRRRIPIPRARLNRARDTWD